jgi:hypothetical protein
MALRRRGPEPDNPLPLQIFAVGLERPLVGDQHGVIVAAEDAMAYAAYDRHPAQGQSAISKRSEPRCSLIPLRQGTSSHARPTYLCSPCTPKSNGCSSTYDVRGRKLLANLPKLR